MISELSCRRSLERGRDVRVNRSVGRDSRNYSNVGRHCIERSLAGVIGIGATDEPIAHFEFDIICAQATAHAEAIAEPYLVIEVCAGARDDFPLVQRQASALGA